MIDKQNWENFQTLINRMGLTWECSQRSNKVVFMDLTITLTNGKITTKLFAKPMALHLYIPPSHVTLQVLRQVSFMVTSTESSCYALTNTILNAS